MGLSPEQRDKLVAAAQANDVDEADLVAAAEHILAPPSAGGSSPNKGRQDAKLYMYLLPFVRVREVRNVFLGLTEGFPGDNEVASDWATKHPIAGAGSDSSGGDPNEA